MSLVQLPPAEQRFVLSNIDWDTYLTYSDSLLDRPIRFTYDGTNLELRTLSFQHLRAKKILAYLLATLTEEMDIAIAGFGSMTWRREDRQCGFEPDECYWIEHEPEVRGRNHIDPDNDPPPDLVMEVEISRSFLDRLAICARLNVPEVWRWDGQTLRVMLLETKGRYSETECSRALPFLPIVELARFLNPLSAQSDTKWLRSFRAWVREQMARGWGTAAP
jgi:Uma2 family endonuclease